MPQPVAACEAAFGHLQHHGTRTELGIALHKGRCFAAKEDTRRIVEPVGGTLAVRCGCAKTPAPGTKQRLLTPRRSSEEPNGSNVVQSVSSRRFLEVEHLALLVMIDRDQLPAVGPAPVEHLLYQHPWDKVYVHPDRGRNPPLPRKPPHD